MKKRVEILSVDPLHRGTELEQLAKILPGAILSCFVGDDGTFTIPYASEAAESVLGLGASQLKADATSLFSRIAAKDLLRLKAAFSHSSTTLKSLDQEFRVRHPEGHELWVKLLAQPENLATGGTLFHGFLTNITRQKATEVALRDSEERFRRALEHIPDVIVLYDLDLRIRYINEATRRITGLPTSYFLGKRDDELWPEEVYRTFLPALTLARDTGVTQSVLTRIVLPDQEAQELRITCVPLFDEDGKVKELLGVNHDLTELRKNEHRLRKTRDRLREAIEAGSVGLWDWDVETGVVKYSAEWKRQLGYEPEELSDTFETWESRVHPEDMAKSLEVKKSFLNSKKESLEVVLRLRHKDGSYRHILSRGSLKRDSEQRLIRVLGSHIDITERLELQNQLLHSQRMESVGHLAGAVAHDFNNLLTIINCAAESVAESLSPSSPRFDDVQAIRDAGGRAASLTGQLIAFSRKQVNSPEVVQSNNSILGLKSMLQRAIGENIKLQFQLAENLRCVKVNPGLFAQVLMNLVINARDAMPHGGNITIATRMLNLHQTLAKELSLAQGYHVCCEVTDTGDGIAANALSRIFEPFYTTKEQGKGTGLGLSSARTIIEQSGGAIRVSSELGKGTRFEIYLPCVEDKSADGELVKDRGLRFGHETILVVEDEPGVRNLTNRLLSRLGYTVFLARDGEEALKAVDKLDGAIDLIFTDMLMPGMTGRELAEVLRGRWPGIPILLTSGYAGDEAVRRGTEGPDTQFIAKPYSLASLGQKLRAVLSDR